MASTHKSLRSGTANKRPTTSIADGQIALNTNTTSPGLFFKDSTGATIIKVGPVHVGTTAPNASPAAGGSAGNSVGEIWLDTSLTPVGVKIWNGSAFVNATPIGSTTVQGLLELATNAETQTGTDPDRAVTPAGLQSKVSDSTSTTSSTTIASSTAVKSAYDLANAALPKSGGTVTGNLEIGTTGSLSFEGATADAFETTIAVVDPTADRTITLPDTTGTVVTTGDTGTVTSTMIADGTIVDGDISASAEIAVSKLADGAARQLLQTDAAGTGVEWASNIDVPGTLDVTSTATFDSIASHPLGSAAAPTLTFTGDTNTGIYSPGADQVAISTGGSGRLFVDASGRLLLGTSTNPTGVPSDFYINNATGGIITLIRNTTPTVAGNTLGFIQFADQAGGVGARIQASAAGAWTTGTDSPTNLIFNTTPAGSNTPTERLRITSAGLVGVGTSAPSNLLEVSSATNSYIRSSTTTNSISGVIGAATSSFDVGTTSSHAMNFYTAGVNRATLDTSGRLGIGTSSPTNTLHLSGTNGVGTRIDNTSLGISAYSTLESSGGLQANISGSGFFSWVAGGGEKVRIDNSGRLGIGTTSPVNPLDVNGNISTNGAFYAYNSAKDGLGIWYNPGGAGVNQLTARLGGSDRLTIDSSGRLLVGTSSSPSAGGGQYSLLTVQGFIGAPTGAAFFSLQRGETAANITTDEALGLISFNDSAGNQFAEIVGRADGNGGANDYPGRLVFSTTADGASSPTERMRINSNGAFLLTSNAVTIAPSSGTGDFYVQGANAAGANARIFLTCPGSNEGSIWYERSTSRLYIYSQSGGVYLGSTATSWTANSDERLKDIIEPIENAANKVSSLRAVIGKYKTDEEGTRRSFLIAQDVQAVLPEAVDASNPDSLGVSYTDVIPLLVAAIKEQQAMIADLQGKVAALESA